ncbi:MAG: 2-oxoacid:acceptor oxidoreductase family protein [Thermodesulfobacteriota bacterium]
MTRVSRPRLPHPRVELRLAGSGGQGLILAGLILAEAAGVYDGREVAMVQSYGPEARGGASKAEVILSDESIDYPLCTHVDLFLAMNQEASDAYCWDLKPGAWILVDKDLVSHPPSSRAVSLAFTTIAHEKLGKRMVANIVALGAISAMTGLVSKRALEKALLSHVPSGTVDINRRALTLGIKLGAAQAGKPPATEEEEYDEEID